VFAQLSDGTIVAWTSWVDSGIRSLGLFPV
jgi:hypothetical protein